MIKSWMIGLMFPVFLSIPALIETIKQEGFKGVGKSLFYITVIIVFMVVFLFGFNLVESCSINTFGLDNMGHQVGR